MPVRHGTSSYMVWDPALSGSAAALRICGLQGHSPLLHGSSGYADGLL